MMLERLRGVRLSNTSLAAVDAVARAPLPPLEPCPLDRFAQSIRIMAVALKRRADDDLSGQILVKLYHRHLGDRSKQEIEFLTETATRELTWFPTVAECLVILGRWHRCDTAILNRSLATRLGMAEREERYRDLCLALVEERMTADEAMALPERTRRRLDNDGFLRMTRDGVRLGVSEFTKARFLMVEGRGE
jgi:hypothetical protein